MVTAPLSPLAAFEEKVWVHHNATVGDVLAVLRSAHAADADLAALTQGEPGGSAEVRATRLLGAVVACIVSPKLSFGGSAFLLLFALMQNLKNLMQATGLRSADHGLRLLGVHTAEDLKALARTDRQRLAKALLLIGIDGELEVDMAWMLKAEPQLGSLLYLGLLSSKPVVTLRGHERRTRLLQLADQYRPNIPNSSDYLVFLSNVWMQCSYADVPGKHRIKAVLNPYVRHWLQGIGCQDAALPAERVRVARPRMVVAAEVMHSNHVQYRYFGQYLRQLRQRFELILVTEEGQVDDHVRALFDAVHTFQRSIDPGYLRQVRELIVNARPDVVFWPSMGMRHWGTALGNLRLAPIQFTALGHSASTFSPQIDYYLTEAGYVGDPALFGEKVLQLPDTSLRFERSPHVDFARIPRRPAGPRQVLRIALPSNLLKLNPVYIRTLERIAAQAQRPLAFEVFPNVMGAELVTTRRVLGERLPNVTVHPVLNYARYLQQLSQCDLNLSPFPFGGLHSVIDSLRLGLPVVALEGQEPHARTDAMLLRRLGMPEWLITHDVAAYEAAAVRVLQDDALRQDVSRQALAIDIDRVMFGDAHTPLGHEVVDAVWGMYQHHERLQALPQRVLTERDWA